MSKAYLVLEKPHHSFLSMVRAPSMLAAFQRYALEGEPDLRFHDDGAVTSQYERSIVTYPHVLAYIEAQRKIHGEWQIREMPEEFWQSECTTLFCGENPDDIEMLRDYCLPVLRQEFPRVRPRCFVWYLRQGALVTFYRRRRRFEIEVIRRYLVAGRAPCPWTGGYQDILENLWGPQPMAEGLY